MPEIGPVTEDKAKSEGETVFSEREKRSARNIPIEDLFLGELNERLDPGDIEGLSRSIKQVGVLEPLLVRPVGNRYEVIAGGRRLRAAQLARAEAVPCVVKVMDDVTALKASFHENEERKSASPLEYGLLAWKLAKRTESLKEVADLLGKTVAWVESRINAYELYQKANIRLTEKGPGGKHFLDEGSEGPALGLVDANQIMQFVSSPRVRRYVAQLGGEPQQHRTRIVRELSEEFLKLSPPQKKKVLRELRRNPSESIAGVAKRVVLEPVGIKVSISFNAEISGLIETELEGSGEKPESWIRRIVIDYLRERARSNGGR